MHVHRNTLNTMAQYAYVGTYVTEQGVMKFTLFQRRKWHPTLVLLPGKSHGWRSLVGYSPWGREESDVSERLHFSLHALEKEMATHSSILAWRIPGTEESGGLPSMGTRLKRLSSSSSSALFRSIPSYYILF